MKVFFRIVVFSLAVIGFYTLFAVWYIPRSTPGMPPEEKTILAGPMTMDEFIANGKGLYSGKGACALCHNPMGRAPLLDSIAATASGRIKDNRYRGAATNAEEYIYESMVDPSRYVVAGYGVPGTNDTESPMPDVRSPVVGLNDIEIRAIVAYLQSIAGVEVTVKAPSDENHREGINISE